MQCKVCEWCKKEYFKRDNEKIGRFLKRRFCSVNCKTEWFGESRKKENKIWTDNYKKEYARNYRQNNRKKIRMLSNRWAIKNRERDKELNRNERDRLKLDVLSNISGGVPKCNYCGYLNIKALSLDHINNNGGKHRMELFGTRLYAGTTFYRWIRKNNYPEKENYQVLCMNCQFIKKHEHARNNSAA